jgi:hypothetical protein
MEPVALHAARVFTVWVEGPPTYMCNVCRTVRRVANAMVAGNTHL